MELRSIQNTAWASKIRVAYNEGRLYPGAAEALHKWMRNTPFLNRLQLWGAWYAGSHYVVLRDAMSAAMTIGINDASIGNLIVDKKWGDKDEDCQAGTPRFLKFCQKAVTALLRNKEKQNAEYRVRHNIARWNLDAPLGIASRRVLRNLEGLHKLVAPRVAAAWWQLLWNGWITARRMQQVGCCGLHCGCTQADSVEHYVRCARVRLFARRKLRLEHLSADHFFLAAPGMTKETVTLIALLGYSVMTGVFCVHRSASDDWSEEDIQDMLDHRLVEAVRGHKGAFNLLANMWVR